jgi:exosortase D (VPLPA-CTERM-specific)
MLAPSAVTRRTAIMRVAMMVALSVLVAALAFGGALTELVTRWARQEEYGHGFLIPLISCWLLWARRDALVASVGQGAWMGVPLLLLAAALNILGELSALFLLGQVGFVIALYGIVLSLGGYALLRVAFIPVTFLLFAIPLPYFLEVVLTWRLQLVSSVLGVLVIRLFQIPVYLEGNIIDLGHYKLQVVEACSGLRYLYPLASLGFLAAYFFHAPMWQRALVVLSSIPITILMNSLRIGIVGVLVNSWGTDMAEGLLHFFEGWIIFVACAALLLAEICLLAQMGAGKSLRDVFGPPKIQARPGYGTTVRAAGWARMAACPLLLCLGGAMTLFLAGRQEAIPERQRFVSFPSALGQWQGRPSLLEPQEEHALGLDDYILSDYRKANGRPVNLYVAYYPTQRKGLSPHSPVVCMPGGGWQIAKFERTMLSDIQRGLSFPLNRAIVERGSMRQIVYYWFVQRGRHVANEYVSKWYLFRDAIVENRTDGALVRVTTPIFSGESESDADARLQAFTGELEPRLREYLPSRTVAYARGSRS